LFTLLLFMLLLTKFGLFMFKMTGKFKARRHLTEWRALLLNKTT